jgi:hypothetical protein
MHIAPILSKSGEENKKVSCVGYKSRIIFIPTLKNNTPTNNTNVLHIAFVPAVCFLDFNRSYVSKTVTVANGGANGGGGGTCACGGGDNEINFLSWSRL